MSTPSLPVEATDRPAPAGPPYPIVVVLDRLRSAYNVGNIFRLAECCQLQQVITCGYTAAPPHPKLAKAARGCEQLVPCRHFPTSGEAVAWLHEQGFQVVAVETIAGAVDVRDAALRFPCALVFGNEALGIAPETLAQCDLCARLPVYGRKNSLNVGNCAAVAVYAAVRRCQGQ